MVAFTILPLSHKPQAFKATSSVVRPGPGGVGGELFCFNWSENTGAV